VHQHTSAEQKALVLTVLGRAVIKGEQRFSILGRQPAALSYFAWYLARKRSNAASASVRLAAS